MYQAPSVRKAFQVLHVIAGTDRGMGISELAKSLGSEVLPQERSFFDWLKETLGG